jgi:general secretion pathway protein E
MSEASVSTVYDHRLTLAELLGWLVDDGLIKRPDADLLLRDSRLNRLSAHPLVVIADQKWKSLHEPPRPLNLEVLGEWLAARVGSNTTISIP